MRKNIYIPNRSKNLLSNTTFINQLQIEAAIASKLKGGHHPFYLKNNRKKSLVSNINILSREEQIVVAEDYFIGAN
ncbi:MAG: hypothetical protein IPM51_00955 [Sphingobacteriaceae bacterium]|nr:hypothetical protein [Sphingobacteriaceae bacterium]